MCITAFRRQRNEMELDCSKLMLGGSRRDGWGTIGGLGAFLGYAPGE